MNDKAKILIADDDVAIVTSLRLLLSHSGFEIVHANSPGECVFLAEKHNPDLLLLDMNYTQDTTSGSEGLDLIARLRQWDEQVPVVVMTGWATIDLAVAAMQKGANDFVQKPWDNNRLISIIQAQLKIASVQKHSRLLSRENQILKEDLKTQTLPIIAQSSAMQSLLKQCKQAAPSDACILITGENGTGKSLLAETIHQQSMRCEGPLIIVNMGAIPESLFESELFGHAKGAFTDAKTKRLGRVELAEGGTLFLDEIGNMPLTQQSKLLQLLENKTFQPVGSSQSQTANVRVIAATNANLAQMVQDSTFRMDLLYRLNTLTLTLPTLKARQEDIVPLAEAFCQYFANKYQKPAIALSPNTQKALQSYHWPGNIRELSHVIERAVIFAEANSLSQKVIISADELMLQDTSQDDEITASTANASVDLKSMTKLKNMADLNNMAELQTIEAIEKRVMQERLAHFNGNANQAATSLGLSRSAFYRRLDKYKLME